MRTPSCSQPPAPLNPLPTPLSALQSIASAGWDKSIRFWDLATRQGLGSIPDAHRGPIHGIVSALETGELASFGAEGAVRVWSTQSRAVLYEIDTHAASVGAVCWSAAQGAWVTGASDGVVRVWRGGRQQSAMRLPSDSGISALLVDDARKVVLAAGRGRSIHVLSLESGQPLGCLLGHSDEVGAVVLLEERSQYVSVSLDGSMRFWSANRQPAASSGPGGPQSRADRMLVSAASAVVSGETDVVGEFAKLHPLARAARRRYFFPTPWFYQVTSSPLSTPSRLICDPLSDGRCFCEHGSDFLSRWEAVRTAG